MSELRVAAIPARPRSSGDFDHGSLVTGVPNHVIDNTLLFPRRGGGGGFA